MSEIIEADALLVAEEDSIVSTFIIDGLMAHCEDEEAMQRVLLSILMNVFINKLTCPFCFIGQLADVVDDGFTKVTTEKGHDVVFKHAKEVTDAIKGGNISH